MITGLPTEKTTIKHVAIAGNIGAGKTTLTEILARHFGWDVHYENTENNPYLSDFYLDMKRWSFNLQVFFLSSRYQQVLTILRGTGRLSRIEPSMKMLSYLLQILQTWA